MSNNREIDMQVNPAQEQEDFVVPHETVGSELLQNTEEQLLDVLTLPEELQEEIQDRLQEVAIQALATTINPHDRHDLAMTVNIVAWRLLSAPGDPLPAGLVQGYAEDGTSQITYDTRLGFGEVCAREALHKLHATGLENVTRLLGKSIEERHGSEKIQGLIKRSIEDSQALQFIQTLANGGLQQQKDAQPLTPFWRMIRETQATHSVRERWGLTAHEAIEPRTEPDYDLRRELSRIDDETMQIPSSPDSEPLTRLRSYLEQAIQTAFNKEKPDEAFIGFGRDEDGDRVIRSAARPEGYWGDELYDYIQLAAHTLAQQINEVAPHVQRMAEEYIFYLMRNVVWPEDTTPKDFTQLSEQAIEKALWIEESFTEARYVDAADYSRHEKHASATFHNSLLSPSGSYIDLSQLPKDTSSGHEHYSGSPETPRACINTLKDKPLGEVLRVSPNGRSPHAHRLIQSEPKQELSALSGNEELVISLFGEEFKHGQQPYIPGYRLVGNTQNTYGFVRDERGDPYASADIPLTPEQSRTLVKRYTEVGLEELAQAMQRSSHLTVQGLTSLVADYSVYTTRHEADQANPPIDTYIYTLVLSDFRQVVRNGRPHVQCSGAAQLLRLSLETIFGRGSAATTGGYQLSRRTISTNSKHEQTVFTHEGRTYLLDATPSSLSGHTPSDYLFKGPHMRFGQHSLTSLAIARTVQTDPRTLERAAVVEYDQLELREHKIASLRRSFDTQLTTLLETPHKDAAYDIVNKLPEHDPFSRTLHVVLRASYKDNVQEDIKRLSEYLQSYEQADESLRRQMNVRSYDDATIRLLRNTVEQLSALV